ncbi:MAG TPA: chorismate lyase [Steroidobacteraceae bacterium]|nr:chorismate lyase [Steroidobacteraceae bacterium]
MHKLAEKTSETAERCPDQRIWLGATELRQRALPDGLCDWLTFEGLLTERLRQQCATGMRLRLIDQQQVIPDPDLRVVLDCEPEDALQREIELLAGDVPVVFARTVIPQSTVARHPWLADLGTQPLGETLATVPGVTRGPFEFTCLEPGDELYERIVGPGGRRAMSLWARRSWFALDGHRLAVTEAFLPAVTRL